MKKITHEIFSISLCIFVFRIFDVSSKSSNGNLITYLCAFISIFIGILPDVLDFKLFFGKHRNWLTHSVISPILIPIFSIGWIISSIFSINMILLCGITFCLVWEFHIILDSFTAMGIYLLKSDKRKNLAHFRSDDIVINGLFSAIGLVMVLFSTL